MLLFNQHSRKKVGGRAPTTVTVHSPTGAEGGLFRSWPPTPFVPHCPTSLVLKSFHRATPPPLVLASLLHIVRWIGSIYFLFSVFSSHATACWHVSKPPRSQSQIHRNFFKPMRGNKCSWIARLTWPQAWAGGECWVFATRSARCGLCYSSV